MREGRHGHEGFDGPRGHYGKRGCEHDEKHKQRFQSAQTFRRGRAVAFLERLDLKRSTLVQQLDQPEYESIRQVISGELKAVDSIIQEFIHAFELRETPAGSDKTPEEEDTNHERN